MSDEYSKTATITRIITHVDKDDKDKKHPKYAEIMPDDLSRTLIVPLSLLNTKDSNMIQVGQHIRISPIDEKGNQVSFKDYIEKAEQAIDKGNHLNTPVKVVQAGTAPTNEISADGYGAQGDPNANTFNFENKADPEGTRLANEKDQDGVFDNDQAKKDESVENEPEEKPRKRDLKHNPKDQKIEAREDHILFGVITLITGIMEIITGFTNGVPEVYASEILLGMTFFLGLIISIRTKKYGKKTATITLISILLCALLFTENIPVLNAYLNYTKIGGGFLILALAIFDIIHKAGIPNPEQKEKVETQPSN